MTVLTADVDHASATPAHDCHATDYLPKAIHQLYRWYFGAALVVLFTAGASWGAWLLWQIGLSGKFVGTLSIHAVNAHGQAQIYGWVCLFVMGFGYHILPRFWRGVLPAPRLAVLALLLMFIGILVRLVGMLTVHALSAAVPLATAGCLMQVAAAVIFATQMAVTCGRARNPFLPESGFILLSLAWFVVMAIFDAAHTYTTMTASTRDNLLWFIATFQAPLRDIQIHGFALCMILGISSRMIPAFFSRRPTSPRRGWIAVALITTAVIGETIMFLTYRLTGNHLFAGLILLPWLLLVTGIALQTLPWQLWHPAKRTDRSDKFIRTAYLWLAISLAMLLFLPFYQMLTKIPFSHAYYGAIRHAITVGFISLMIMGMAARFIPAINAIPARQLPPLWVPFVLVNAGCVLRVTTQTLTDFSPAAFWVIGISGSLEVIGLAIWASSLIRMPWRSHAISGIAEADKSTQRTVADERSAATARKVAGDPTENTR